MMIITHLLCCWSCSDIRCKTVILVLLWDLQCLKTKLSSLGDSSVFRVVNCYFDLVFSVFDVSPL